MIVIRNKTLRAVIRTTVPFVLIPACVLVGVFLFDEKRYALVSLLIALLSLLLFAAGFERKKTGTRRLVIVSVMVALSVAGRFLPLFKPVTALTVLTGVYLGPEAGFLTGSLAAAISNFYFGQGPWTPFQMFALGLIGFCAGLMPALLKRRPFLVLYGVISGIAYSFIMDVWTVLWYNGSLNFGLYLTALSTAVPYTVLYAVSNAVFLWAFAKPFGEKLERIRLKYGV